MLPWCLNMKSVIVCMMVEEQGSISGLVQKATLQIFVVSFTEIICRKVYVITTARFYISVKVNY